MTSRMSWAETVNIARVSFYRDAGNFFLPLEFPGLPFPSDPCALCQWGGKGPLHLQGTARQKWVVNVSTYIYVMSLSLLAVRFTLKISLHFHFVVAALVQIMAVTSRTGVQFISIRKYQSCVSYMVSFSVGSHNLLSLILCFCSVGVTVGGVCLHRLQISFLRLSVLFLSDKLQLFRL